MSEGDFYIPRYHCSYCGEEIREEYVPLRVENSKGERRYLCTDCLVKGLDKVLGKPKIKNRE